MSAKKSEMLSTMGTIWEIVKNLWNAVLALGGTDEDMRNILKPSNGSILINDLALVILGKAKVVVNEVSPDFNPDYWVKFYKKYLNCSAPDFSGLKIPKKPTEGNWRLLVILKGLTNNWVYGACAKQFPCWRYGDNLDKAIPTNERDPKNGSYAVWVRDTVEADPVHKNKSADTIKEAGLKTETLLERMIHELVYFLETLQDGGRAGKHLDVNTATLCSGSRHSGGDVPRTYWGDSKFQVNWEYAGHCGSRLRSREVIEA
jgi:hypothetical protein